MDSSVSSSGEEDLGTALQHITADSGTQPELETGPQPQLEVSVSLCS